MAFKGGMFMLTCRKATQLLSEKQDRSLALNELTYLQLHLLMCISCRRYAKQIKVISILSSKFKQLKDDELNND